jgi:hypothetical protein
VNVSIMVWVTKSMFFSNLKLFFRKWTFIFVHFWFFRFKFEKNDSLHFHPSTNRSLLPYWDSYFLIYNLINYTHHRLMAAALCWVCAMRRDGECSAYACGVWWDGECSAYACGFGEMESVVRTPAGFGEMEYLVFFGIH